MIEIITPQNRHQHGALIESMYRLRYQVFVRKWGWKIPDLRGDRDCDAFDTLDTVYFIECAPNSEDVIACARLNPTTKPHMFSEIFSYLCDLQPAQNGEHIFEASRYAIDRNRMKLRELVKVKGRIEWALTWYSLRNKISKLTWLMSKDVYARNIQLWDTTPLGLPVHFDDDDRSYIPAISDIDDAALIRIANRYRLNSQMPICVMKESGGHSEIFVTIPSIDQVANSAA